MLGRLRNLNGRCTILVNRTKLEVLARGSDVRIAEVSRLLLDANFPQALYNLLGAEAPAMVPTELMDYVSHTNVCDRVKGSPAPGKGQMPLEGTAAPCTGKAAGGSRRALHRQKRRSHDVGTRRYRTQGAPQRWGGLPA